jgi:hypothetical protein
LRRVQRIPTRERVDGGPRGDPPPPARALVGPLEMPAQRRIRGALAAFRRLHNEPRAKPSPSHPNLVTVIHATKPTQDHERRVPSSGSRCTCCTRAWRPGHNPCYAGLYLDHKLFKEMHERPPRAVTVRHATTFHSSPCASDVCLALTLTPFYFVGHGHARDVLLPPIDPTSMHQPSCWVSMYERQHTTAPFIYLAWLGLLAFVIVSTLC